MSYFDTLYQASYNGIPFGVESASGDFGRRIAEHEYPFRDTVWPEDIGKKPREFEIRGFLLGDDVLLQAEAMIAVCEQPGPGILIHPTRGIQSVVLRGLHTEERRENGRVTILNFRFIQAGQKLFPSIGVSTGGAVQSAAAGVNSAASADFVSQAAGALAMGASVVRQAASTTATYAALGQALVKGGTNLFHLSSGLPGTFGRYFGGSTGSGSGSILGTMTAAGGVAAGVGALIAQGATARAAVASSAGNLNSVAGAL